MNLPHPQVGGTVPERMGREQVKFALGMGGGIVGGVGGCAVGTIVGCVSGGAAAAKAILGEPVSGLATALREASTAIR
jgi:hypothetical protein